MKNDASRTMNADEDYGFDGATCGVMVALDAQSADIAQGVDDSEVKVGDIALHVLDALENSGA